MATSKPKKKTALIGIALLVAAIVLTVIFLYLNRNSASGNLAIDAVKPLEASLNEKGGVKYYTNGDDGKGSDNKNPWYQVFYELPMNQDEALTLVNQIAEANGYKLTHASPNNRGPLGVADAYIDKWYYDHTSKQAPYDALKSGTVQLAFIVDGPDSTYNSGRSIPGNHSVVGIDVRLPEFK